MYAAGSRAIFPGALTIGAICTLLQVAYNEAGIVRLRYIYGLQTLKPATPIGPPAKSLSDRFLDILGVQVVTEDEYLKKMKLTRDAHLKRIAELEQQLAVEKAKEE